MLSFYISISLHHYVNDFLKTKFLMRSDCCFLSTKRQLGWVVVLIEELSLWQSCLGLKNERWANSRPCSQRLSRREWHGYQRVVRRNWGIGKSLGQNFIMSRVKYSENWKLSVSKFTGGTGIPKIDATSANAVMHSIAPPRDVEILFSRI